MRPEAESELAGLREMVLAWKEDYLRWASTSAPSDFLNEVEEMVYPYLRRLYECKFIDSWQASEFMRFCEEQAREISNSIKGVG